MGTRADFYVGRGTEAEWLGSYPFDGYPEGIDTAILTATTEQDFRVAVGVMIDNERGTLPEHGWPWPWEDSRTTDFAYALDDGKVWASCFGHAWFDPIAPEQVDEHGDPGYCDGPEVAVFPDMTARKATTYGPRSGLIVLGLSESAP